ncbi:MAG: 50S ribosomal protein L21 [Elusimicrobiota bacterium]
MFAVIAQGKKQYKIVPGEVVNLEKIPGNVGDKVEFDQVILFSDQDKVLVGKPKLAGAKAFGEILLQDRAKKVVVFKKKRKKGYRRTIGHRQSFTQVKFEKIEA